MSGPKPHRILVTGAAGVIGTELCSQLRAAGYSPLTLDLKSSDLHGHPVYIVGDLCDEWVRIQSLRGISGVIHLAAVSRVNEVERNTGCANRANLVATQRLLEDMAAMENPPWLVFTSSREVYGEPSYLPVDEVHPLKPVNIYGSLKKENEKTVLGYSHITGAPVSILRLSNVYGSHLDYLSRVVPSFLHSILTGREVKIKGRGKILDLIHIHDVVRAIRLAGEVLMTSDKSMPTINVASGVGTTLEELVCLIERITGRRAFINYQINPSNSVHSFVGDNSRMGQILGFGDWVPFELGLNKLESAYRSTSRLEPVVMA